MLQAYDFLSRVQEPYLFSIAIKPSAASATRVALTAVIQRWSIGHSRNKHGLHATGSRTTRLCVPVGPVASSSVAPKIAIVGTPRADAICMGPESFVRKTSQA